MFWEPSYSYFFSLKFSIIPNFSANFLLKSYSLYFKDLLLITGFIYLYLRVCDPVPNYFQLCFYFIKLHRQFKSSDF